MAIVFRSNKGLEFKSTTDNEVGPGAYNLSSHNNNSNAAKNK